MLTFDSSLDAYVETRPNMSKLQVWGDGSASRGLPQFYKV